MSKIALRASLCYNEVSKNVVAQRCWKHPEPWINLCWRLIVNTLPPHAQNGNIPEKQCSKCGRFFPSTTEFFHRNSGQLRPDCKECRGKTLKNYYEKPEVHEQKLAKTREYRNAPENRERILENKRNFYQRPDKKKHKSDYHKVYRIGYYSRPGKMEHKHTQAKEYVSRPEVRERHRAYDRTFQHLRRARKRNIAGKYTVAQIQDLLRRQRHRCYYCSEKFVRAKGKYVYHIDHTFPLSRVAGTNIPANDIGYLVLTCPTCNMKKNNKFPWEWPEGGRLL